MPVGFSSGVSGLRRLEERGITARTARRLGRTGAGSRRVARSALRGNPLMNRGAGYLMGGPLVAEGRGTLGAVTSASATFRHIPGQNAIRAPRASRVPSFAARNGKYIAAAVVGGIGIHAARSYSGRGVDRVQGRPRGIFDY